MAGEIWTFSEQKNNQLRDVSFELLTWGRKLALECGTELCAVVLANGMSDLELEKLIQFGADKVYVIQDPIFEHFLVEPQVQTMQYLLEIYEPEIIIAAATTTGRTVMPYLSILVHTGLTADCTDLQIEPETGHLLQIRPAIGGNIMATIKTPDTRPQMATVRPKSINLPDADLSRKGKIIPVTVPTKALTSRMRFEMYTSEGKNSTDLEEANIVVSGGLGLQASEQFELVENLATTLGATVGSSRPPVDHGWQPYVRQVGLSGKTISPELYIACGISGAVQHLAGIQTAKNIIAINNDPEAPIFQIADFGIVGDINDVLPVLKKYVSKLKKSNCQNHSN